MKSRRNPAGALTNYLIYIDSRAAGVIEAKEEGSTPTSVEVQSGRYAQGQPATLARISIHP